MPKLFLSKRAAPILALIVFALLVTAAFAHPLGNFTINHYARLELASDQIRIRSILDYAEIPTFQEKQNMDVDSNGALSETERAAYLDALVPRLIENLTLTVNNQPVPLTPEKNSAQLEFLPGQGGLEVMRVSMWLDAPFNASARDEIQFRDDNYSERLGWREIVARDGNGVAIQTSNVSTQDLSNELTAYPENLLTNPPNIRQANLTITPGAGTSSPINPQNPITTGALGAFDRTREEFGKLLTSNQELSPTVLLISFLAAIALGALHAFSPGHGKAVVCAYLVGSRGTWQHAVFLGLVVTITHTAGVYALGGVTLFLSEYILPEQLFPWLGFISGALVAIIGIQLFLQRLQAARTKTTSFDKAMQHIHSHDNGHSHDHDHQHDHTADHEHDHADDHAHDHAHDHQHEHAHAHNHPTTEPPNHPTTPSLPHSISHSHSFATPEEEAAHAREHLAEIQAFEKPSWKNLLSLGISGGLLPCPSALVVMLSAIALGRVLYGLFLIIGFSLGLASVLVLTGLALLYAGKFAGRMFGGNRVGSFMRYVPIVGAFLVALLGIGIALDAFLQTGLVP